MRLATIGIPEADARRDVSGCIVDGNLLNEKTRPFLVGGALKARECADFMGVSPQWIRNAIAEGATRQRIKLQAEILTINGRRTLRIHEHHFRAFLQAIGWKHLPRPTTLGAVGFERRLADRVQ